DLLVLRLQQHFLLVDAHLQLFQPILSLTQAVFLAGDVGLIRLELARALVHTALQVFGVLLEAMNLTQDHGGAGHRGVLLLLAPRGTGGPPVGWRLTGGTPVPRGRALNKKTAGPFGPAVACHFRMLPSRKPSSCRLRTGCCSLRTALASICRTRSRVTLKMR